MSSGTWGPRDAGSAPVEFLGAALVLLVPLVYLVLTLAALQAAAFAVESAAREAARAAVTAEPAQAPARVAAAVGLALADQRVADTEPLVEVACPTGCTTPGGTVVVTVGVQVPLPLVPAALGGGSAPAVPVSATVTAPVDSFGGRGATP